MPLMARQPPAARTRELAVALHDLAWLLPRTLDPQPEAGPDVLPGSELEVMRLLVRRPGLSVGEAARELGLRPSNASAAIRGLLARGLLERRADERDSRVTRLAPTAKAQAIRRQREAAWGKLLRAQLKGLPADHVSQLLAAVEPLRALAAELSAGD
jgi:DNA-binding MarR family transcriptional regulator